MEITIKGTPKEIADLVCEIQSQQSKIERVSPLSVTSECLKAVIHEATYDTDEA